LRVVQIIYYIRVTTALTDFTTALSANNSFDNSSISIQL